jgi:glutathione synthase/RimK-type ligase-like ATP-grasp enzyme
LSTELNTLKSFLEKFPAEQFLIKPHRGQGGWGIRTFAADELMAWYQGSEDLEYILQPYMQGYNELRYFFIGDEWSFTLERLKSDESVGANFRLQGKAMSVPAREELSAIIRQVRSEFALHYGAMDILIIDGECKVLEINAVPGIEQLEEVSAVNVIKVLLNSLK